MDLIEFHKYSTAIIGQPNSGKYTIILVLKFVLGSKESEMEPHHLSDLIRNGKKHASVQLE